MPPQSNLSLLPGFPAQTEEANKFSRYGGLCEYLGEASWPLQVLAILVKPTYGQTSTDAETVSFVLAH
ncbi:hypothetical protein PsYK624_169710 [Phanerochaete sordida]|uniref:Uncharacterized protein n=1 Tax=Phanerochaete sordida TaxID=48140 RepID=A0A9P3GT13_9APHY|nr:hypothetical protein PsYK624_169710 [Phanerochaete sordida]